jgi:hypothetical protein
MADDQQALHDCWGELHQKLYAAYWAASTAESKDRIIGVDEVVVDIITALDQQDLAANTPAFKALAKSVADANARLKQLQKNIDMIVHNIQVAKDATSAIDQAVGLAATFFKL